MRLSGEVPLRPSDRMALRLLTNPEGHTLRQMRRDYERRYALMAWAWAWHLSDADFRVLAVGSCNPHPRGWP